MPRLITTAADDVPAQRVRLQRHGSDDVRAIACRFVHASPTMRVTLSRYDPGVVIERHGHSSDHAIMVLGGHLTVGEVECPARTIIVLEQGAVFGPLVAGPDGTELIEFYGGDATPVPADPDGFARLLADRGITPLPNPDYVGGTRSRGTGDGGHG